MKSNLDGTHLVHVVSHTHTGNTGSTFSDNSIKMKESNKKCDLDITNGLHFIAEAAQRLDQVFPIRFDLMTFISYYHNLSFTYSITGIVMLKQQIFHFH